MDSMILQYSYYDYLTKLTMLSLVSIFGTNYFNALLINENIFSRKETFIFSLRIINEIDK